MTVPYELISGAALSPVTAAVYVCAVTSTPEPIVLVASPPMYDSVKLNASPAVVTE